MAEGCVSIIMVDVPTPHLPPERERGPAASALFIYNYTMKPLKTKGNKRFCVFKTQKSEDRQNVNWRFFIWR